MKRLLIVASMLCVWANPASAAIFVTWTGTAASGPGIWDWTYLLTLQPDQTMTVNDFATIYDVGNIAGYDPVFNPSFGATVPGTFSVITTPPVGTGVTPGPALPPGVDDPALSNVTVQLTAGNDIVGNPAAGPTILGTLHIKSTSNVATLTDYLTQSQFGGGPSLSSGTVEVAVIPEASSLILMMAGLLATGGLAFRRLQKWD
jgi:hypothetical protein